MLYALGWFVVLSPLALWSLATWAVHDFAVWTASNAGALTGAASGVEGLGLPEWPDPWVIWGLGNVLLVLLGAGLHLLIAIWRRRGGGSDPQPHPQMTA